MNLIIIYFFFLEWKFRWDLEAENEDIYFVSKLSKLI